MSNSWAERNPSPFNHKGKGGLSYLDLPPWVTSFPGSESLIDTRRKGWCCPGECGLPRALLALPPRRARSRPGRHLSLGQVRRLSRSHQALTTHSHYQHQEDEQRAEPRRPGQLQESSETYSFPTACASRRGDVTGPSVREGQPAGHRTTRAPRLRPQRAGERHAPCLRAPPPAWRSRRRRRLVARPPAGRPRGSGCPGWGRSGELYGQRGTRSWDIHRRGRRPPGTQQASC